MSGQVDWQRQVLCRYYMMGVCQRADSCPYSHDRSISNKGTIPCRFFQAGTCANWDSCRFSHGEPEPEVQGLTISLEAGLRLEVESDLGSEASSGYCDSQGGFLEAQYVEGAASFFPSPLATLSPTYYTDPSLLSPDFPDSWQLDTGALGHLDTGYPPGETGYPPGEPGYPPGGDTGYPPGETGYPPNETGYPPGETGYPPGETGYEEPAVLTTQLLPPGPPSRLATLSPSHALVPDHPRDAPALPQEPAAPHDPPLLTPLPGSRGWAAPQNWAEAQEFVPGPKVEKPRSWAQVVNTGITYPGCELSITEAESLLCPFFKVGECRYGVGCAYIHGHQCDYCGQACLHPTHLDQRRGHLAECLQEHERDMELSFAVARSKEKTCGICMETVLDKPKGEARFGILPNCTHCFCLPCIRKWRQAKQFEHKIIRACPECRQTSDYICPSRFWVETVEEKERLLGDYKKNLGLKVCKYFNKGVGECPFGNKCFYQHADKDGRTVDVGPPKKPLRRADRDGNLTLVQRLLLYDFLEERDGQLVLPLDFVELLDLYSDDSDEWEEEEQV